MRETQQKGPYAPKLLHSLTMPNIKRSQQLDKAVAALVETSMTCYARRIEDVQAEIDARFNVDQPDDDDQDDETPGPQNIRFSEDVD